MPAGMLAALPAAPTGWHSTVRSTMRRRRSSGTVMIRSRDLM
ncbi:hypothetical protein [Erythrobacter oryzae]|nr:hypothetical protein [Erythrobacter sp. COR-2]